MSYRNCLFTVFQKRFSSAFSVLLTALMILSVSVAGNSQTPTPTPAPAPFDARELRVQLTGQAIDGVTPVGNAVSRIDAIGDVWQFEKLQILVSDINLPVDTRVEVYADDILLFPGALDASGNGYSQVQIDAQKLPSQDELYRVGFSIANGVELKVKAGNRVIVRGIFRETVTPNIVEQRWYQTAMSGAKVVPAVQTNGFGTARALVERYPFNSQTISFTGSFSNLSSRVTSVTVHSPATTEENAPVKRFLQKTVVDDPQCPGVCGGFNSRWVFFRPEEVEALRQGKMYVSVNTVNFPNGEIRTNLFPTVAPDDFQGDGRADYSVFRPSNSRWYIRDSATEGYSEAAFGTSQDKLVPADYDGDGKTDIAIYRPVGEQGYWYINLSESGTVYTMNWGLASDVPVRGDFNGDRRDDLTVYRASSGTWYTLFSDVIKPVAPDESNWRATQWGMAGDVPVAADFNGDEKTEYAVYRPSQGNWYILDASATGGYRAFNWGLSTDIPLVGDFTGDRRADLVVFRPSEGNWYINNFNAGYFYAYNFGLPTDVPVPADYDGDGVKDIAVYRSGTWYVTNSSNNKFQAFQFGMNGDVPTSGLR